MCSAAMSRCAQPQQPHRLQVARLLQSKKQKQQAIYWVQSTIVKNSFVFMILFLG